MKHRTIIWNACRKLTWIGLILLGLTWSLSDAAGPDRVAMPLPSPTYALVDGVLVASLFRSAVIEGIDALHGRVAQLGAMSWACTDPGAVPAVERYGISWAGGASTEGRKTGDDGPASDETDRRLEALNAFLRALHHVQGVTYRTPQGRLMSYVEIRMN